MRWCLVLFNEFKFFNCNVVVGVDVSFVVLASQFVVVIVIVAHDVMYCIAELRYDILMSWYAKSQHELISII